MENKFIRILSPAALAVVTGLDISVLYFIYFAINKLKTQVSFYTVFFLIMVLAALIIAFFVTKEILSHGVIFRNTEVEFTALDENNIFKYEDIQKIEFNKDTKASLKKNFVDRQSRVIIYLNEDKIITIDIGLTTKKLLTRLEEEFSRRISR